MAQNTNHSSFGVGLPGLLFLLFTGLKLTGYIDWSWWWVTAPLWGGALVAMLFVAIVASIAIVVGRR